MIEKGRAICLVAETAGRELGRISLYESLALTALVAQEAPGRRAAWVVGPRPTGVPPSK